MAKITNLSISKEELLEMTEEQLLTELKEKGDVKSSQLVDYSVSNLPDNIQLSFKKFDTITDTNDKGEMTRSVILHFIDVDGKPYKSTLNRLVGFMATNESPELKISRNGNFYIGDSVNPELSGFLPNTLRYLADHDIMVRKIQGKTIPYGTKVTKENYLKKLGAHWLYQITSIEQE